MLTTASSARAQTWAEARTTPVLGEIVAIDATGEAGWLYGFEDLAGDGETFKQQEKSIDIAVRRGASAWTIPLAAAEAVRA